VPTKCRRHAITETREVKAALDELRREQGHDHVDLAELVVLGAEEKLARVRSGSTGDEVLDELIDDILHGRDVFGDPAAADEAKRPRGPVSPLDSP
jgi:hypothetical protein